MQHVGMKRPISYELVEAQRKILSLELVIQDQAMEIARHHRDFDRWEEIADKGAARIAENVALRDSVKALEADVRELRLELTKERFPGYVDQRE